jgi:hypothetical protein
LAGEHTRGGDCGLIGFNAENLTKVDSRMKVNLKVLPDKLRGVAWPSSARTLRRAVKSVNERDPHYHLLSHFQIYDQKNVSTMVGPLVINPRKEWATVGPYGPNTFGYTRSTMVRTMRCNRESESQSPKPNLSSD